jgi:hypothetical protein
VIQNDPFSPVTSSILELPANGQGSVTPTATLNPPANTVFFAVAVDQSGNLYVGAVTGVVWEIFEYAAGATGVATPMRTIYLSSGFALLAVDSTGQVYTLGLSGINVLRGKCQRQRNPHPANPRYLNDLGLPLRDRRGQRAEYLHSECSQHSGVLFYRKRQSCSGKNDHVVELAVWPGTLRCSRGHRRRHLRGDLWLPASYRDSVYQQLSDFAVRA